MEKAFKKRGKCIVIDCSNIRAVGMKNRCHIHARFIKKPDCMICHNNKPVKNSILCLDCKTRMAIFKD